MQQRPTLARGHSNEKRFFITARNDWNFTIMEHHDETIEPHENDVLMGRYVIRFGARGTTYLSTSLRRGGLNNKHSGNEKLRQLARQYGSKYKTLTKKEKSDLSRYLVRRMRDLDPPARYVAHKQTMLSHAFRNY